MKKLKMLGFILCGILLLNSTVTYASPVLYTENNTVKIDSNTIVSKEVYARIALDFANGNLPGKTLSVTEMTPIINSNNDIFAYDCKISENEVDHGYVIVNMNLKGDYISEFNLEKNIPDFYEQMVQHFDEKTNIDLVKEDIADSEQVLVETLPNEYSITVDNVAVTSSGKVMAINEFEEYQKNVSDVIGEDITTSSINRHAAEVMQDYPNDYSCQTTQFLSSFNAITQSQSEKAAGKYGCAVTAMAIVADRYDLGQSWVPSNLKLTYNDLWSKSGTTETHRTVKNGKTIIYGATQRSKIGPALVSLAKDKNISLKYRDTSNPGFNMIKNAISNKHDVIFGYCYNDTQGHAVAIQGTWTGKKNKASHGFIIIADGWTTSMRYINYTTKANSLRERTMTEIWK